MKVLVACETSGIVRRAFDARGHDVWSCDLLPSEDRTNRHIIGDARRVLNEEQWDLLMIAHPPCTRLCLSGLRWLHEPPTKLNPTTYDPAIVEAYKRWDREQRLAFMWHTLDEGAELFSDLWNADVPMICAENPIMHRHAKARIVGYEAPAQTVQPWQFGEPQFKGVSLYLRKLPKLAPTRVLTPPKPRTKEHRDWSRVARAVPGHDRWKDRSRFFPGIADAMADQWGDLPILDRRLAE